MMHEISRVYRRVLHAIRHAKLTADAIEGKNVQEIQAQFSGYELHHLSSSQHYGLASSPLNGCDVVVVNIAGDNSNGIAISSNDPRYRPTNLSPGEVMLYDNHGQQIWIKQDGSINILATNKVNVTASAEVNVTTSEKVNVTAPLIGLNGDITVTGETSTGGKVTIEAGDVTIKGNITLQGTLTATGDVVAGNISLENHVHSGVQTGSGDTGPPVP